MKNKYNVILIFLYMLSIIIMDNNRSYAAFPILKQINTNAFSDSFVVNDNFNYNLVKIDESNLSDNDVVPIYPSPNHGGHGGGHHGGHHGGGHNSGGHHAGGGHGGGHHHSFSSGGHFHHYSDHYHHHYHHYHHHYANVIDNEYYARNGLWFSLLGTITFFFPIFPLLGWIFGEISLHKEHLPVLAKIVIILSVIEIIAFVLILLGAL